MSAPQDYRLRIVWLTEGDEIVYATSPRLSFRFAKACVARAKRPDSEILEAVCFNVRRPIAAPEGCRRVELPLAKFQIIAVDREAA